MIFVIYLSWPESLYNDCPMGGVGMSWEGRRGYEGSCVMSVALRLTAWVPYLLCYLQRRTDSMSDLSTAVKMSFQTLNSLVSAIRVFTVVYTAIQPDAHLL